MLVSKYGFTDVLRRSAARECSSARLQAAISAARIAGSSFASRSQITYCSPRNPAERRADDELDARTGLRTFNEIRRGRGLEPYVDPRFDEPIVFSRDAESSERSALGSAKPAPRG